MNVVSNPELLELLPNLLRLSMQHLQQKGPPASFSSGVHLLVLPRRWAVEEAFPAKERGSEAQAPSPSGISQIGADLGFPTSRRPSRGGSDHSFLLVACLATTGVHMAASVSERMRHYHVVSHHRVLQTRCSLVRKRHATAKLVPWSGTKAESARKLLDCMAAHDDARRP